MPVAQPLPQLENYFTQSNGMDLNRFLGTTKPLVQSGFNIACLASRSLKVRMTLVSLPSQGKTQFMTSRWPHKHKNAKFRKVDLPNLAHFAIYNCRTFLKIPSCTGTGKKRNASLPHSPMHTRNLFHQLHPFFPSEIIHLQLDLPQHHVNAVELLI